LEGDFKPKPVSWGLGLIIGFKEINSFLVRLIGQGNWVPSPLPNLEGKVWIGFPFLSKAFGKENLNWLGG